MIFSSHLLEQVQEVADRVAIFSLGKKVLEGSLDSLLTENRGTQIDLSAGLDDGRQEQVRKLLAQAGIDERDVRFTRPASFT